MLAAQLACFPLGAMAGEKENAAPKGDAKVSTDPLLECAAD